MCQVDDTTPARTKKKMAFLLFSIILLIYQLFTLTCFILFRWVGSMPSALKDLAFYKTTWWLIFI